MERPDTGTTIMATCRAIASATEAYDFPVKTTNFIFTDRYKCLGFCGLAMLGVAFILPWISRSDIRSKYHLTGNGCKDCLCACCCAPCDMTQQAKEVEYREETKGLLSNQPGKMDGMHYQQQTQYDPHSGYGHSHWCQWLWVDFPLGLLVMFSRFRFGSGILFR